MPVELIIGRKYKFRSTAPFNLKGKLPNDLGVYLIYEGQGTAGYAKDDRIDGQHVFRTSEGKVWSSGLSVYELLTGWLEKY